MGVLVGERKMNLFRQWGFTGRWWRGERGEYLLLAQIIFFFVFLFLPVYPQTDPGALSSLWQYTRWFVVTLTGGGGILLVGWGLIALSSNLTPLPYPREEGVLVTQGAYCVVRHPLYSGVFFLALAYSAALWSVTHVIGAAGLFLLLNLKASREEQWLRERFEGYSIYQAQVKKLIPWVY